MLSVNVLGSSSGGNCYVIDNGSSRLMLECGLPWRAIRKALNFQTSSIDGILVTHEHMDHAKAVKEAAKSGMDLYMSKGTAEALGVSGHRVHPCEKQRQFTIKGWTVIPFGTVHDAVDPLGFLVSSGEDKLLFLTDTAYCEYRFTGLTHLLIECNFSNEILERNVENGTIDGSRRKRLLNSHLSLDRVKDFLKVNGTSSLVEIWLMHLSDENSDEAQFKKEIQQETGVPVYVCGAQGVVA